MHLYFKIRKILIKRLINRLEFMTKIIDSIVKKKKLNVNILLKIKNSIFQLKLK